MTTSKFRLVSLLAAALLALALASPALARPLDGARRAGLVGEQADGYLGIVSASAPADVVRQVQEINAGQARALCPDRPAARRAGLGGGQAPSRATDPLGDAERRILPRCKRRLGAHALKPCAALARGVSVSSHDRAPFRAGAVETPRAPRRFAEGTRLALSNAASGACGTVLPLTPPFFAHAVFRTPESFGRPFLGAIAARRRGLRAGWGACRGPRLTPDFALSCV